MLRIGVSCPAHLFVAVFVMTQDKLRAWGIISPYEKGRTGKKRNIARIYAGEKSTTIIKSAIWNAPPIIIVGRRGYASCCW